MTMISQITASGGGAAPNYIEDVFSTYLYTGNGSTQTITNGIDLSTKGGMVWTKGRTTNPNGTTYDANIVCDTNRGAYSALSTNSTAGTGSYTGVYGYTTTGFNLGSEYVDNNSSVNYASWTFRKQPKFFDVVTWTGDGTSTQVVPHSLASQPGFIIIKSTDYVQAWTALASDGAGNYKLLYLNTTANSPASGVQSNVASTSNINVGWLSTNWVNSNATGKAYVAYIFASNAGGFGLTGTDNVISCGSFTSDSLGQASVNLGYEPQWVMIKRTDGTSDWTMLDNMRGWAVTTSGDAALQANTSNAETSGTEWGYPTATGFSVNEPNGSTNWIYIAIRRGPMKVPTDGTKVFATQATAGAVTANDKTTLRFTSNFPIDLSLMGYRAGGVNNSLTTDRLRGFSTTTTSNTPQLVTSSTNAESVGTAAQFDNMLGQTSAATLSSSSSFNAWMFRRAPNFFDEVCYTGTGTNVQAQPHNLGVAPELIIIKTRSNADSWFVGANLGASTYSRLFLESSASAATTTYGSGTVDLGAQPTSTNFYLGTELRTNGSARTYVAYLFASCPGVSKVGSYTGTGTTQQINCGFTGGARFILIKRTDSTGDWYVYDSARGIVAGNDPYLLLNSTAAEVTSTDYVDTYAAGFELSSTAPAALNASGGTFIFLAIA